VPLNDEELLHSLRVEQEIAIRRENYEMAARLRDKIKALQHRGGPAA
jgi:protein-arginine kinase activator protein McsA